jgi:hypothetical protein
MMSAAWLLLGVGMGLGLYDAAFGALGRIYGENARRAITGITLIAGFASTVGWPLSSLGLDTIGWRGTCYAWAAAHMLFGLPLNMLVLPKTARAQRVAGPVVKPHIPIDRTMILLSLAFAAAWTVTSAMAAHLPRIVEAFGATPAQAVFAGMMIGPAQVAARVLEASTLSRFHPLFSTLLACITHPIGACVIGIFGGGAAAAFALLHGAGNGILTIARGTLPPGDLRSGKLRLSTWSHRGAIAHRAGAGASRFRTVDRTDGTRCGGGFVALDLVALMDSALRLS